MRFVVPQFIEVEDKIIGPISVRQFVIFLVAFAIIFILYNIFSFILFIFLALGVFGMAGITAFAKVNGQAFHYFVLNILYTIRKPKLKIWSKVTTQEKTVKSKKHITTAVVVPQKKIATTSKLTRLSLVVDTGGAFNEEEDEVTFKV